MNIVQIRSGLGNQMFQYAFYMALKRNRPDTKIDASIFRYRPSHTGYELERLFSIQPEHCTIAERNLMADIGKDPWSQLRRALGFKRQTVGEWITEPDPAKGWCSELLQAENSYLQGYWQSEKYFASVKEEVKQTFQFRLPMPSNAQKTAQEIGSVQSISVHIRRGDYLKKRRIAEVNICSENYYRRAVEYIQEHVDKPVFYVFSDDPQWAPAQGIFPKGTVYVSGHTGKEAYLDMQLMSLCRHHIIANSSFSWWGAWLGQGEGRIILAPNRWYRHQERPDILPHSWITIPIDD